MSPDHHFDAVTRAAAEGVSRRQIMRMLAGGIAGGTLVSGLTSRMAWGAANPCVERCGFLHGRERGTCMRICNQCRAQGGQICQGGTGTICCESDASCCVSVEGELCCPPGSSCCIGRKGALTCCPDETECCNGGCCPPGQCCTSTVVIAASCCPADETCCFDPDFRGGDNRCGTLDESTGYCVPV
jgi:hypothetical protein